MSFNKPYWGSSDIAAQLSRPIPVKGAVALEKKIVKSLDDGKVGFFYSVQARAETSNRDLKCQRASGNIEALAETSKREPKRQSASRNLKM